MLGMIDLKEIQPSSSDLFELQMLLQQLVGQPFLFFKVSYGDELTLHFGPAQVSSNPKMKRFRRGAYMIGTRASAWLFRPSSQPVLLVGLEEGVTNASTRIKGLDIRQIETGDFVRPGSIVSFVKALPTATGFGLLLILSDDSGLHLVPTSGPGEASEGEDIADWEVFTPHERYLRVGPGLHWAYLDSGQSSGTTVE
jgi:hypothetical protein